MSSDQPQTLVDSASTSASRRLLWEVVSNRGFVACAMLLLVFAIAFHALAVRLDIQFRKLPTPLKVPLDRFDQKRLAPYKLLDAPQIIPQVLDALGTKEYVQWLLEDTSIDGGLVPEKIVNFFVTYYTGNPDQVPHVPEECYSGAGLRQIDARLDYVRISALGEDIPVKILEFEDSSRLRKESRIVMYTFNTNGKFCGDRQCVRFALGDLGTRHAYFSKVEVTFGRPGAYPPKDKAIEAGKKFFQVAIPVLLEDHWPDWQAVLEAEKSERVGGGDD